MKHILNDLSEQEKNSIREQHTGGMKVMTESFSKLINSKLGDVKLVVKEQITGTDTSDVVVDCFKTHFESPNMELPKSNVEILGGLLKNLSNTLPPVILGNMAKSAISGDVKTFNQVLDQEKARLGQDYTKLKNALTQGDQAKTLKNIGAELQPYINQMKSGMGNQPSNVKEDMDVSSDSDYYQERQREVSIPFDDLAMLGSLASRFCSEKENFPDCKQVRRLMSRHNLFM